MSSKPLERPVSSASLSLLFVRFLACLYIHFSAVFFGIFLKLYISCWLVYFQVIHIKVFFCCELFWYIVYGAKTHLIAVKRWNCQVSVHKCTDNGKFATKTKNKKNCYISHHFEYQTDPLLVAEICYFYTLFLVNY